MKEIDAKVATAKFFWKSPNKPKLIIAGILQLVGLVSFSIIYNLPVSLSRETLEKMNLYFNIDTECLRGVYRLLTPNKFLQTILVSYLVSYIGWRPLLFTSREKDLIQARQKTHESREKGLSLDQTLPREVVFQTT